MTTNTHLRQLDIFKPELHNSEISIIGAGATGSMLCFFLTKMGMNNIRLYDFDFVEEHNGSNQLFKIMDLNQYKAEQTSKICEEFTGIKIRYANCKYERQSLGGIVILAVDSMKCRKEIFNKCKDMKSVSFIIDPRSGPTFGRVYTIDMKLDCEKKFWEDSYYPDNRTENITCTANAIIFGVGYLVSIITNQIKRILMQQDYKKEIIYDIDNYITITR